ncbi:putative ribonuclease H-like domain-containing protein [Tanacetum coccineum]|uniref:Ribonuclease H-like domain-containing protein n=1 Tax=Tanacetum coccineum TaxID=301880 RepID=A0ABQ4ZJD1_9ASTR
MLSNSLLSSSTQSTDDKDADKVPDKGDNDVSQINGQEKEGGASNKEDDQHVQDFRAELDSLLIQQKEGYANSTNRDSTASPSVSTAGPSINTASENINTGSPNINTANGLAKAEPLSNMEDHHETTQTRKMTKISKEHAMIKAMQEELLQFKLQKVWTLVDLPKGKRTIRTKWVYRNKKDERGIVVRNKARLVAQSYTQEEGIDYDEVFATVARIEAIRLFLAYASFMGLIVYQMDVKSAFLYGTIKEEVVWYETLSTYLLENGYRRGTIDKTLFIKKDKGDILLVQMMHKRFQMSSIGELTFFLELKVQQKERVESSFSPDKYVADILKKFDFVTVKTASTPMEPNKALVKDEEADNVDVHLYRLLIGSLMYLTASRPDIPFDVCACARDSPFYLEAFFESDYVGASLDKKFTIGGCQFLGKRLISWQCKKQTIVANSTTEAEYVATANCYGHVLWIPNQMLDYGFNFMNTKIYVDNESIICIVKNPVIHSKTKHIEIRHHFIRDSHEKKLISGTWNAQPKVCFNLWEMIARWIGDAFWMKLSHIMYTLTKNPTIYVSLIEKFWQTATVRIVNNGEQEINTTVDGKEFIITEASVRRHLQLASRLGKTHPLAKTQSMATPTEQISQETGSNGGPRRQETWGFHLLQTRQYDTPGIDDFMYKIVREGSSFGNRLKAEKEGLCQRITKDAEVAQRLQEGFDASEKQKMAQVYQAAQGFTKDEWEDIRARVEAEEELTQKLQAEERDKYSEVDQAMILLDLINQRKRYFEITESLTKSE